ncbi:MAG: DUF1045 domain-containing protein [Devosia sp.]
MTARYAIYFAPARDSALLRRAEDWLAQPDLAPLTVSARRYGFHATIKAPMTLTLDYAELDAALAAFADEHNAVTLSGLAPRLIDGFLALTAVPQPTPLTDFAAQTVEAFEPFREPLSEGERARRLKAPLTPRQIELVDQYGYPYVLEEFLFHMTLTDRLPANLRDGIVERAEHWFADVLAKPVQLDRLVVFAEPEPGAAFERLDPDYVLRRA